MPPLSPRHEIFCAQYVTSFTARHAAIAAGYSPRTAAQQASRLLRKPEVAGRIAEIRAEIAHRHCANADALMAKLEAIYGRALEYHHFNAAGRAVELQAKLAGLLGESKPGKDEGC